MKSFVRSLLSLKLAFYARQIIHKYKPIVVMVTGSVGKTSTKDAVAAALTPQFYLRKSEKSFNSEIGVPLTIIGAKNPWLSMHAWFKVFRTGVAVWLLPNHYPKLLVLEVGADHPGDLAKIAKIVTPSAVVVTLLPEIPVHVEMYTSPAAVREEEFYPATLLPHGAPLIINADDSLALRHAQRVHAAVYTFGYAADADVRIQDLAVAYDAAGTPTGMRATLHYKGATYECNVPGTFGRSALYAPASALALAGALGMNPADAIEGLKTYMPPPGRGSLFAGIHDTTVIDDSYNSSPVATEESLRSLELLPGRKVAVLGDMLELGRYSVEEHERIGRLARSTVDVLVTVGSRAGAMGTAAMHEGEAEEDESTTTIYSFQTAEEAAEAVPPLLEAGDTVLVKGSQGVRLERVVRLLLAHEEDRAKLVRQDAEWQKR